MKNIIITVLLIIIIGLIIDIVVIKRKVLKDVSWIDIIKFLFKK